MIKPHGGRLVNRFSEGNEREELESRISKMPALRLNARERSDLEMIATGAMSPLEGFMTSKDYGSVLDLMRLSSGLAWSIPVVLALKEGTASNIRPAPTSRSPTRAAMCSVSCILKKNIR